MLYYDLKNMQIMNDADLIDSGHRPEDLAVLAEAEIFPLTIETPDYDTANEGLEPDGNPMPDCDKPGWWIQRMRVYSLVACFKKTLKEQATERRWIHETAGITLQDGTRIATGIDDQNRIASALQGMGRAGLTEVDFKAESGWVRLSVDQLSGVAASIASHVQACFSRERALHEMIDTVETMAALEAIDVDSGWPGAEPSEA